MSTRALQVQFLMSGLRNTDDTGPLNGGTVEFFDAGTSNAATLWATKEKTGGVTSVTLSALGQATIYGDGVYKFVIKDSDGTEISYSPIDNFKLRAVNTGVVEVSTTYTASTDDDLILCDTSGGAFTVTLYAAANFIAPLAIKNTKSASNSVTVDGDGSETIDGGATATIADNASQTYYSDGSKWFGAGTATGTTYTSTSLISGVGNTFDESSGITTVNCTQATTTAIGSLEIATDTEAKALTDTGRAVVPSNLSAVLAGLLTTIVEIGNWDMNATTSVTIAHGIADQTKIREVTAMIIADGSATVAPLNAVTTATAPTVQGGVNVVDATNVVLYRTTSGIFDNTTHDSTPFNRGWIVFKHIN